MTENLDPRCSICGVAVNARACYAEEGKGPDNCPTKMLQELAEEANQEYADAKVREFARLASVQDTPVSPEFRRYVSSPIRSQPKSWVWPSASGWRWKRGWSIIFLPDKAFRW